MRSSHIFAVKEYDIYGCPESGVSDAQSQLSSYLQQNSDARGAIIGSRDIIEAVGIVLFFIAPRACVVMGTEKNTGAG
jgi:hypothetical protein